MFDRSEQQHLKQTLSYIDEMLIQAEGSLSDTMADIRRQRRDIFENTPALFHDTDDIVENLPAYMAEAETVRKAASLRKKKYILLSMQDSPYFGRIRIQEAGHGPEDIYIGISTLWSPTDEPVIYDWRAPVCSLFYEAEPGEASYRAPAGDIPVTLTLKRQYRIEKGVMRALFDTDLKIDDPVLQDILSRQTSARMRTIVTTIQRQQNQAIRTEGPRHLLVHGPAGSGKTSVALHRAAWLLYRYKDTLTREDILILSPNSIFSDYISEVLPSLGEDPVPTRTFMDLTREKIPGYRLEDPIVQTETLLTRRGTIETQKRLDSITYKSSHSFLKELDAYVEALETDWPYFKPIRYRDTVIMELNEIKQLYGRTRGSVTARLDRVRTMGLDRIHQYRKVLTQEILETLSYEDGYINRKEMRASARLRAAGELREIRARWYADTGLSGVAAYADCLTRIAERQTGDIPDLCRDTLRYVRAGHSLRAEDIGAVLYLSVRLDSLHRDVRVRHIILDEVQDYTPIQLAYLAQAYPQSRLTLVGDINQRALVGNHLARLSDIGLNDMIEVELSVSYRSTSEITRHCTSILGDEATGVIRAVDRHGPPVRRLSCGDGEVFMREIRSILSEWKDTYGSIALITRTMDSAHRLHARLRETSPVHLVDADQQTFVHGVVILPVYLAKGLEFDAVIVLCPEGDAYDEGERLLYYTACSRALHGLCVLQEGNSPCIENNSGYEDNPH